MVVVAWPAKLVRASPPEKAPQEVYCIIHYLGDFIVPLSPFVTCRSTIFLESASPIADTECSVAFFQIVAAKGEEEEIELWISYFTATLKCWGIRCATFSTGPESNVLGA